MISEFYTGSMMTIIRRQSGKGFHDIALILLCLIRTFTTLSAQPVNSLKESDIIVVEGNRKHFPDFLQHIQVSFLPYHTPLAEARSADFIAYDSLCAPTRPLPEIQTCWLRFAIENTSATDTAVGWFCGGGVAESELFCIEGDRVENTLGGALLAKELSSSLDFELAIPPGKSYLYYYRFRHRESKPLGGIFLKSENQWIDYHEYNHRFNYPDYCSSLIILALAFCSSLFCGILNLLHRRSYFAWYSVYAFSIGLFFLMHFERVHGKALLTTISPYLLASELPYIVLPNILYAGFASNFFSFPSRFPKAYRLLFVFCIITVFLTAGILIMDYLFFWDRPLKWIDEAAAAILVLLPAALLYWMWKTPGKGERIAMLGALCLLSGSIATSIIPYETRYLLFGNNHLFLFKIGCGLELLFFLVAIGTKSKEQERQAGAMANELRLQISRDLHDEMGSALSSISILSAAGNQNPESAFSYLEKIGEKARTALESISDIVWMVNPGNDAAGTLWQRMTQYASETLEPKGIELQSQIDEAVSGLDIEMKKRREVYLIFKEVLHNIIKHSYATEVTIQVTYAAMQIEIRVVDNGKGFNLTGNKQAGLGGNGLKNMQQRAAAIGANLLFRSAPGKGTEVVLQLPLGI